MQLINHLSHIPDLKLSVIWSNLFERVNLGRNERFATNLVVVGGPLFNKAAEWLLRTADPPVHFVHTSLNQRALAETVRPYRTFLSETSSVSGLLKSPSEEYRVVKVDVGLAIFVEHPNSIAPGRRIAAFMSCNGPGTCASALALDDPMVIGEVEQRVSDFGRCCFVVTSPVTDGFLPLSPRWEDVCFLDW
jgi:hypothetical protein